MATANTGGGDSLVALLSTSRRRYQARSDPFLGVDEFLSADDEPRTEYLCPFCAEEYDAVGLCCHIHEDHPVEARTGVCPLCAKGVGMDMVGHITMQHASFFKMQYKRRLRKGGSNSTVSIFRKELREGNLKSLLEESSRMGSSPIAESDPLLSSFICKQVIDDEPVTIRLCPTVESTSVKQSSEEGLAERNGQQPQPVLSDKDQLEKARKCQFVQGLLLSTILDDYL